MKFYDTNSSFFFSGVLVSKHNLETYFSHEEGNFFISIYLVPNCNFKDYLDMLVSLLLEAVVKLNFVKL